ncbi:MAG: class I SAM-dependent methyltransferase [Candidatus Didemnitutus sp.]|nr:class I SAM-dependent methyltransferase [Candidatus Didemnitutus sp.]
MAGLSSWQRMTPREDFSTAYLIGLFGEMAKTYGAVNLLSSFGFSHRWRKQCVERLAAKPGDSCADLMSGNCETSLLMAKSMRREISILAVDFCPAMTRSAIKVIQRRELEKVVTVRTADVLRLSECCAYDCITVAFGIKTLSEAGLKNFAHVLQRMLKPGGRAVLVEISVPPAKLLRIPYLFYLRHVVPLIGQLMLGNPDCYRSLALYTEGFAARDNFETEVAMSGLSVRVENLFFGCAKLYLLQKPRE